MCSDYFFKGKKKKKKEAILNGTLLMNFINGHLLLDQLFLKHAKKEACISAVEFLSLSSPPTMQTILPPCLEQLT